MVAFGCISKHQIFSFAKIFCVGTALLYDLASLFRGRRITLERWDGKIARRSRARLSAQHSALQEASQNRFAFDVVKFEN